jgi:hypothetical protein
MKKSSIVFLKAGIVVIAIGVLAGLIWFPQTEGRATNLDLLSIYTDPLIIYTYVSSTLFFIGLYQAFKLLQFIDADKAFSQEAITTLKNIKFVSISLIGFIILGLLFIRFFTHGDDPAGPTMLGICVSIAFGVIATIAGIFQKLFQNAQ